MDETPNRTSGIPRPSRLPKARPTSAIPKPTSTIPRPSSTIRPAASRESLSSASASASGRESVSGLRSPGLRASASRDQLRSSINAGGTPRNPRLRASASRDQLVSGAGSRASLQKPSHPPVSGMGRGNHTVQRRASAITLRTPQPDIDEVQPEPTPPETDEFLFKRRLTLTRRPSEVLSASSIAEINEAAAATRDNEVADTHTPDIVTTPEPVPETPSKAKPSLSARTIETLANISSPAVTKKTSSFFDQGRPASRSENGMSRPGSRPGSSYNSDGSGRVSSRAGSRPGSSAGRDERGSISSFKNTMSTIEGTPRTRPSTSQPARTPVLRKTASRPSLASASKLATPAPNPSPSPSRKTYGMLPPKSASRTVADRPSKSRGSVNGLFKKPSLPSIDLDAARTDSTRNPSINSVQSSATSWDGTIPSNSSTASGSTAPTTDSPVSPGTTPRKSSAALREQIAKAKAAKRAAMKQVPQEPTIENDTVPVAPAEESFDYGAAFEDPFNLRKGENPKQKVLKQRVGAARSSGRLNIAALELKEIPVEVLKMYDLESMGANDGSWAESVDLTRFVAADNELEKLDDCIFPDTSPENLYDDEDGQGNIFAGLETLDLHRNLLVNVPLGFRRLAHLTSLNLSSNRLTNNSIDTIAQMPSLRDLKLANNLFFGPLNSELSNLTSLEILDLHGNNVSALPRKIDKMARLRILNLSENSFESLPFDELAQLPLTELVIRRNKLSGTLIEDPVESFPQLQTLDASSNQLTQLVPFGSSISFPMLHALSLSMNRLQGLPDMSSWTSLLTLTADENSISSIPTSFMALQKLRHADFSSNDIRVVPPEIAKMDSLAMLRLSGNPLRDKKFVSITTDELKEILTGRLEPPPPYQELGAGAQAAVPDFLVDAKTGANPAEPTGPSNKDDPADDSRSDMDDDFATPPTSAPHSPARSRSQTISSLRSRSQTLSNQVWPVKPSGLLDRSNTESSSLHPVVCSRVAAEHQVKQVQLHHNLFSTMPNSLSFFAETLTSLSLAHNQLVGETYLAEVMEFPVLTELNLSSNRITGLSPLVQFLHAPLLEKVDVSMNRINALPSNLKEVFPQLSVLLASSNQIPELEPEMIKGMRIVDASSNEISRLNPRIGLLGGPGGLERLDVMGNRFRVPRWNVLERGTEATLRWLRGRVPVAEMAAWKGADDDADEVD